MTSQKQAPVAGTAEIQSQFASTPWAMKLFADPTIHPVPHHFSPDRLPESATYMTLLSRTLATEDTIAAWQAFYRDPQLPNEFIEVLCLVKLGSGVNGHVDTCHGGFVSVLLDEVLGSAVHYVLPPDKSSMTAYLRVDYKKPVHTPSVVLCRAWTEKVEGRKLFARGMIENGEGTVLATGEGLFLAVEPVKPRQKL